jgi:hypothetical protein
MKTQFFLILSHVILLVACCSGGSIYVDCQNGNDNNAGNTTGSAIRTITRLNMLFSSGFFQSHPQYTSVLLKDGCVFSDSGLSVEQASRLLLSNYNNGGSTTALPTIDTTVEVASGSWKLSDASKKIYSATLSGVSSVPYLFVDGRRYNQSHYPSNPHVNYFYLLKATSGRTVYLPPSIWNLTDQQLLASQLVLRTVRWAFHKSPITSVDRAGGSVRMEVAPDPGYDPVEAGWGFFLMNAE